MSLAIQKKPNIHDLKNQASLTLFVIACWVAWPSSTIRKLDGSNKDIDGIGLRLDHNDITWMVALLDLGNAVSPFMSICIVNNLGRKKTLIIATLLLLPTWLVVVNSTSKTYVFYARFLIGLSKGLVFTATPVYIGEISEPQIRGMLGSCVHSYLSLGLAFSLMIGPYVSYHTLNTVLACIPFVVLAVFIILPESPYYYVMKGNYDAAEKSLKWFKPYNPTVKEDLRYMIGNHKLVENGLSYWSFIKDKSSRKALLIVMTTAFLQRLSGITALITYSSVTLPVLSFTKFGPSECILSFSIIMVVSNFAMAPLMDSIGRRNLLCISLGFGTLFMMLLTLYYYNYPAATSSYVDLIPYIVMLFYALSFSGMGSVPPVLPTEYFSTSYRSFASAAASVSFAAGSFTTSKSYLLVQQTYGTYFIFLLFTIVHIVFFVLSWHFVIETKGKSLEEIQETFLSMNHVDCSQENNRDQHVNDSHYTTRL